MTDPGGRFALDAVCLPKGLLSLTRHSGPEPCDTGLEIWPGGRMDLGPQALCSGFHRNECVWEERGQYPPQEVLETWFWESHHVTNDVTLSKSGFFFAFLKENFIEVCSYHTHIQIIVFLSCYSNWKLKVGGGHSTGIDSIYSWQTGHLTL